MWVKFKHTYISGIGTYPAGQKYDLPEGTLKLISNDFYTECKAPWLENVDPNQTAIVKLTKQIAQDKKAIARLEIEVEAARKKTDELVGIVATVQENAEIAADVANEAIEASKKENATKEIKADAHYRIKIAEREGLEKNLAHGRLQVAIAKAGLKQLDLDDAKVNLEKAVDELGKLKAKIAGKENAEAEKKAKAKAAAEKKTKAEATKKAKAEAAAKAKAEKAKAETEAKARANADKLNQTLTGGQQQQDDSNSKEQTQEEQTQGKVDTENAGNNEPAKSEKTDEPKGDNEQPEGQTVPPEKDK